MTDKAKWELVHTCAEYQDFEPVIGLAIDGLARVTLNTALRSAYGTAANPAASEDNDVTVYSDRTVPMTWEEALAIIGSSKLDTTGSQIRTLIMRVAALEAQNKTLEDNLRIPDCKQCHGTTWTIDSENGGMQVRCHCYQVRVNELRAQNKRLREALEAILKRVALVSPYYEMARAALEGK